jgi:dipeptidyl aminopeptidase/acylaminoacyl peptidase
MLFIAHGTEDRGDTHFSNAQNLERNAIAAGITYEFHPLDGIGHSYDQWEVQTTGERSVAEAFFDFLDRVLFN